MMITYLEKRGKKMGNKSLYYLTCVLFYIVAIINFFNSDTTTGVVWLCLGASSKPKENEKNDDSEI